MDRMDRTAQWFLLALGCLTGLGWAVPDAGAIPSFGLYDSAAFSPTITVVEESPQLLRVYLTMENLPETGTINFASRLPGLWGEMNPVGQQLPRFSVFLALPPTGDPTVTVESWDTREFTVTPPRTLQENNPRPPLVKLGEVSILGGARLVPMTFRPISYVNGAAACSVMYQAVVRVDLDQTEGQNPLLVPRTAFSREWRKIFQTLVVNWESIPNIMNGAPPHILMIVPQTTSYDYTTHIQDFVTWKEQRGCKVTVLPTSEIAASPTAAQIRARIADSLRAVPPVDHVILAGDETRLPVHTTYTPDPTSRFSTESFSGTYANEGYYAAVEGTDFFPDVFVGRWIVDQTPEVRSYVARILAHERNPFAVNSARFERALVAADYEEPSQKQTKRDVRARLLARGFTQVDTVWGQGLSPWLIINPVNNGVAFLNYRGSGWSFGWAGVNFYWDDVSSLSNVNKLPIVTGIGCGVGIFSGGTGLGFGEAWMLGGSASEPTGACGFIGPTWNTHTVYNDCLDSCLYRAWLDYGVRELMPGLVAGKMMTYAILAQFMSESAVEEIVATMFQQYLVQGDPSLQVYTDTPFALEVSVPANLPNEPAQIPVEVLNAANLPADSLNVTLWRGPGDFETKWIRPGETAVAFNFDPADADTVVITITGDNVLAWQRRIPDEGSPAAPAAQPLIPERMELAQNYPNPFNSETVIEFALPRAGRATLEIFDLLGRRVALLADREFTAGWHRVAWSGKGSVAGSGVYFYRLSSAEGVLARKMVLLQ